MTTTAREDRKPGPHAGAPHIGPPITPPPKLRRRPGLVVAAVVITALGCLLGAWAWNATTSTENGLLPTANAPTAQISRITGMIDARGARSTCAARRIITRPSGIMMMLARMKMM